ncbi:hypothetical protein K7957_15675 [Sphingomonas yunnanensis]|uniref:hypothetical protein n=1 Tax=Sphingomonas yunnanensis TaxID=310400 RepID=UPI001CA7164C|nr:hypothetical protein [Sphingomonas yunnanensis]MBY9064378.1 hypothetical protein [Sphingomonas yunnanensis]
MINPSSTRSAGADGWEDTASRLAQSKAMITMPDNLSPIAQAEDKTRYDAAGEAALLLVESLIHELIDRSVLSVDDAVKTVNAAAEIRLELADDRGESRQTTEQSVSLLMSIYQSLLTYPAKAI